MRIVILISLLFCACTVPIRNGNNFIPSEQCCQKLDSKGKCLEELVPGCASDAAPLFKNTFLIKDECCERWSKDGICYKEIATGCSRAK